MIDGISAVDLYGMTVQAEETREKGTAGSTLKFEEVYEKASDLESMDHIFEEAASIYDVPVELLKAVAKAESNFNPNAVSHAGAIGVMQLMPGTASSLGVTNPYDARQNIMGGAKYLKNNLDRYGGDVSLALAAYNAGPGSVEKYGGVPPYAETQNYVKKVASYMNGSPLSAGMFVNHAAGTQNSSGSDYLSILNGSGNRYAASLYGLTGSSVPAGSMYNASSGSMQGTSVLAGFGSTYGSSALTGEGSLYGMSSVYGSSTDMMSMLFGSAVQSENGDTVTVDKSFFSNMIELLRLQMMMNASSEVGSITI